MSGGAYFWRQHTASVVGSRTKEVNCENCQYQFEYTVTRSGRGEGHAPFLLGNSNAARAANDRAHTDLNRELNKAFDATPCPKCGNYQSYMVEIIRSRLGSLRDPNAWAADRAARPMTTAWQEARAENTKEAYQRFLEIWPSVDVDYTVGGTRLGKTLQAWVIDYLAERPAYSKRFLYDILPWVIWTLVILFVIGVLYF